jgi:hypothetical protein
MEITMPGEIIGEYCGEVTTQAEFNTSLQRNKHRDISYIATYKDPTGQQDNLYIDAINRGSLMRFANHSCSPNCELVPLLSGPRPRLFLRAIKTVPPGTEYTFNYNWSYQSGRPVHRCFCNSSLAPHYIEKDVPSGIQQFLCTPLTHLTTPHNARPTAQDTSPAQGPPLSSHVPPVPPATAAIPSCPDQVNPLQPHPKTEAPLPSMASYSGRASTRLPDKRKGSPVADDEPSSRRKLNPTLKRPRDADSPQEDDHSAKAPRIESQPTLPQEAPKTSVSKGSKRQRGPAFNDPPIPAKRSKTGQGNTLLGYFSRSDPAPPR